ncbi:MAG: transposase [Candidatus Nitrosotenuis sp.]
MQIKKILSKIRHESILIGILHLIGLLSLCNDSDQIKRGRPYVYPTTVMLRCFVVQIWFRIPSNNALWYYFSIDITHNQKVMRACGLNCIPDRRTFDRRFKVIPVQNIICILGQRFLREDLVQRDAAVDSAIIPCKKVWHKSDIKQNHIPISGIDTDARWGFSKSKGWIFGYKLHMCCSTGKLAVPLSASISTANVYDPHMYGILIEPLAGLVSHMAADSIYSGKDLYDYSEGRGVLLVCPIRRYRHTKGIRLKRHRLFCSRKGQRIIRKRGAIERLFDRIKDTFGIEPLPVRGMDNVSSYVLVCVFVYQIAIYWNCVTGKKNPQYVKHMLGC